MFTPLETLNLITVDILVMQDFQIQRANGYHADSSAGKKCTADKIATVHNLVIHTF